MEESSTLGNYNAIVLIPAPKGLTRDRAATHCASASLPKDKACFCLCFEDP